MSEALSFLGLPGVGKTATISDSIVSMSLNKLGQLQKRNKPLFFCDGHNPIQIINNWDIHSTDVIVNKATKQFYFASLCFPTISAANNFRKNK